MNRQMLCLSGHCEMNDLIYKFQDLVYVGQHNFLIKALNKGKDLVISITFQDCSFTSLHEKPYRRSFTKESYCVTLEMFSLLELTLLKYKNTTYIYI